MITPLSRLIKIRIFKYSFGVYFNKYWSSGNDYFTEYFQYGTIFKYFTIGPIVFIFYYPRKGTK